MTANNKVSSRKSIFYSNTKITQKINRYHESFYTNMLIDDVGMMILPTKNRTLVNFTNNNKSITNMIARALKRDAYSPNLYYSVTEFFRQCAQTLMLSGSAYYEIVYLKEENQNKWNDFYLSYIIPTTLYKENNIFYQTTEKINDIEKIKIEKEYIIEFNLPEEYKKNYNKTMDNLYHIKPIPPEFGLFYKNQNNVPFDFNEYNSIQNLALANACREIGWSARNLFDKNILDYYLVHRLLLFKKFIINLRNEILSTLNVGIKRIGTEIGFEGEIRFNDIMDLEDVNQLFEQLKSGDITFSEIIEKVYSN